MAQGTLDSDCSHAPVGIEKARYADDGLQLEKRQRIRRIVEIHLAGFDLRRQRRRHRIRIHLQP